MTAAAPDAMAMAMADAEAVLRTQYDGVPLLVLDAVPGSGKTWLVERLAVLSSQVLGERCMIGTGTNDQAIDIARRLGRNWPRISVTLFVKEDLPLPADLAVLPSVRVARKTAELPHTRPAIVVANVARWSYSSLDRSQPQFDRQVIDEAYQILDARWIQVSGLASQHVLVGDPGQIAPIVDIDVARWASNPWGPHVSAPRALLTRDPTVPRLSLRVTHRLSAGTAAVIGPSFYPGMSMISATSPGTRRLTMTAAGALPLDRFIDQTGQGVTLGLLPAAATGEYDELMLSVITAVAERLLTRGAMVTDETGTHRLAPDRIGLIVPHVSQVTALQSRLPAQLSAIHVETANRWQGLETDVAIVWHPLSGRGDVGAFHLDAGRLCVMLSRHRVACILLSRAGLSELIEGHVPLGARVPGIDEQPEYIGWQAHRQLLRQLQDRGSTAAVPWP